MVYMIACPYANFGDTANMSTIINQIAGDFQESLIIRHIQWKCPLYIKLNGIIGYQFHTQG